MCSRDGLYHIAMHSGLQNLRCRMSEELKPCPFCGGSAKLRLQYVKSFVSGEYNSCEYQGSVNCTNCPIGTYYSITGIYRNQEMAREGLTNSLCKIWNRRINSIEELA